MAYDFESDDRSPPYTTVAWTDPSDLEALVTLLEIGAIVLTKNASRGFTEAELFAEAQALAGPEMPLNVADLRIVLRGCKTIERVGDKLRLR